MLINGERALAYIAKIEEIKPLSGYDRVEYARINGWWVIVSKADHFKEGDKCVYFEVDSKVNAADERFLFLAKRDYKIKTIKMCGVYSQGLIMPISAFPELNGLDFNTDVTTILKVTYSVKEDNERKARTNTSYSLKNSSIAKKKWYKWLMRRDWGRKICKILFAKKKKKKEKDFPSFISRTDEERCENQPWRPGDGKIYTITEKLDGTSCTYALERKKHNRYEFYVCSRNVRQKDVNQSCYHDYNIYWELAFRYNIGERLKNYLTTHPDCDWVCIQGEGVGTVQGNPLKLKEDDLYVFNFITSTDGRFSCENGSRIIHDWGMKWVPILGTGVLPDTMEDLKLQADGKSLVNPNVIREGLVYRSLDGKDSFKNVSRDYLFKKHE